jgi:hypothetical protein
MIACVPARTATAMPERARTARVSGMIVPDSISSSICTGAATSGLYDAGVVHRELKPANVMIDGRGRARLTDLACERDDRECCGRFGWCEE